MHIKTTLLIFSWCLLVGAHMYAQKIDSLKTELVHCDGATRFPVLYDLVFEYLDKADYPEALKYIEEAQQVAGQYDDSLHIVKAGRVKGQILQRLDRQSDAIIEFQKVLPVSKRNNFFDDYESTLNALAVAYTFQANYDKALRIHFECLALVETEGKCKEIGNALNNIGFVYYKLGNYEKALGYYVRILDESYQVNFRDRVLINIGLCYSYLHQFSMAERYFNDAMKLCATNCDAGTMAQGEFGIGLTLFHLNKLKEAESHFLVSYKLARKQNDKRILLDNLVWLTRIKGSLGLSGEAQKFLVEAESVANETNYTLELIWIYKEYAKLFTKTRNYKEASFYQAKYIALNDSIYSGDLTMNLMRIQTEFEERENKATIASQAQILGLKEVVIEKQNLLNLMVGMVAILFVMLSLIFFILGRQRKNMNVLLNRKVGERTSPLEKSLNDLHRSHDEQEILLRTISSDINASVATIRGLCDLSFGLEDRHGASIRYVKEFEETAGRMSEIVKRVQRIEKK